MLENYHNIFLYNFNISKNIDEINNNLLITSNM